MKRTKRRFWAVPMMTMALFALVSCNTFDDVMENHAEQPAEEECVINRAVMNLQGGVVPFDATTTRAESGEWEDGANIYLQFTVGNSTVGGLATYNATTTQWDVEYYGTLAEGVECKCEAYYFENTGKVSNISVLLTEHSIIYEDKAAVYMFEDNTLTVLASLKPKTGRLKLKGEVGEKYRFSGVTYYNAYDISQNNFTTIKPAYLYSDEGLGKEGCTDYFYVFFSDEEKRELCFDDMESGFSFVKSFDEKALAVGRSGYLNIPSLNNRSGWSNLTKDITVSGVTFRMIRVLYPNGDLLTPYFYIGETEVTQELWEAVMGEGNNPSTFEGDNLPVNNVSGNDCISFISQLNEKTKMNFKIPSTSEWTYAAQGGCASKGYAYCGGNNPNEVGWYNENSNGMIHVVKTKLPNEIGIYDMSGNVCEYIGMSVVYQGGNYDTERRYNHYYEVAGGHFSGGISNGVGSYYLGYILSYKGGSSDPGSFRGVAYNSMGLRIAIDDIE